MQHEIPLTLPVTDKERFKERHKTWNYIYAFNIRTIRDIFVYCARLKETSTKELYSNLVSNRIPPPSDVWVREGVKVKERLGLEYLHAAEFLGFIDLEKNGRIRTNWDLFEKEKQIIINANKDRTFGAGEASPPFKEEEKKALIPIILDYERARDFLRWFLDLSKYKDSFSFDIDDFRKDAQPIFVLGVIKKGSKGSEVVKRTVDNKLWTIPSESPNDYIRLASFVFPRWFQELGVIDKVHIFPNFSEDGRLWHMYYPIKMGDRDFSNVDLASTLKEEFLDGKDCVTVWVPELLYNLAKRYYCPVTLIKQRIADLYESDFSHFYLDRASVAANVLQSSDLSKVGKYIKESYLKVDGFYRSDLRIIK